MAYNIESLHSGHKKGVFSCGEDSLDAYIHRYAKQDIKRRVTRVFVLTEEMDSKEILGYYSLSAGSVYAEHLPDSIKNKLPRYPIPVVLLGRLAISKKNHGQGLGMILLADAMKRILKASEAIAFYALVVDALDSKAKAYYQQFGFIPFPNQPLKLFLPLEHFSKLLE